MPSGSCVKKWLTIAGAGEGVAVESADAIKVQAIAPPSAGAVTTLKALGPQKSVKKSIRALGPDLKTNTRSMW
ncbi:hypothetical protein N7450_000187 [Penicillium hetheringtonii]|uniref:Uncharacterized protein n=1 Tax=Penicillium hetheringtonii TaxID=911720 RepID=A0AAD6E1W6_9EURO|nr:hypothetical protein N7450_000187 [Penicillium hetheringtonii]